MQSLRVCRGSIDHPSRALLLKSCVALAMVLWGIAPGVLVAQNEEILCKDGDGSFQADFFNGVRVQVRAARNGELATRSCEAILSWTKSSITIATNVPQVDLDAFGADLGFGVPVAAFQLKKHGTDCCMEYEIYSLEKSPHQLRTITGGDFFSAADTDLDGRIEIWTHDAAAFEGIERLSAAEFDSAPTIILRFDHSRLLDASAEFQSYFDKEITQLRKELDSDGLVDFKNSDGRLSDTSLPFERLHRLRVVKAEVLEIIWNYLYSGREQQAWRELADMWPARDVERIRAAILNARAHGIRAQADGVTSPPPNQRKRAQIFDAIHQSGAAKLDLTPPAPILMRRPPPAITPASGVSNSESLLDLVIDSAGKVRSAEPAGKGQVIDESLVRAAYGWKFIPAFRSGKAVASRIRLANSPKQ